MILELLDCAAAQGLFVLLEAFDAEDLDLASEILRKRRAVGETVLVGINCRDLQSLKVVPERFETLAPFLNPQLSNVAESGVTTPDDARRMAQLGFRLALIGSSLMSDANPVTLLADMLAAARTAPL